MPTTYAIPNGRTVMDATLFTGDGTNPRTITNQAGFKPDLIWQKARSATWAHVLFDSVRGFANDKGLYSNLTDIEGANRNGYVSATTTTGYSVATGTSGNQYSNENGTTYVGWQWQAGQGTTSSNTAGTYTSTVSVNATAGFSIVTYTGTGSAGTVGHGLGVAPQFIISKNRSAAEDWRVAHIGLTNMASWHCNLNTTQAQSNSGAAVWNNTTPTSTIFGVGTDTSVSGSGNGIVAYCWAPVAGFSAFGSYTGNGSTDGPFIYLGFRPSFIMVKNITQTGNWEIYDTSRNLYNQTYAALYANLNAAEDSSNVIDILSNGFKLRNTSQNTNTSGDTFIYACFAENPFKYANAR